MPTWTIIGAGPAGIAALGMLLEKGVVAQDITWIDEAFQVGDFGQKWGQVDSNTKAIFFQKFLHRCSAFHLPEAQHAIFATDPEQTCKLRLMGDSLQTVTDNLRQKVHSMQTTVLQISQQQRKWFIESEAGQHSSDRVILALGASPKYLTSIDKPLIPLETALDINKLKATVDEKDTVALFGSSHSAVMIMRDLLDAGVNKVINFYRSPIRYAVFMNNWILFDNTGLKGNAADWAKHHLHGDLPERLERYYSDPAHIEKYLPECTKVVHAVGFERRQIPITGCEALAYNDKTGIIAPGLFGIGIAFPEGKVDPLGNFEYNVGLWKFMTYLERIVPIWKKYGIE